MRSTLSLLRMITKMWWNPNLRHLRGRFHPRLALPMRHPSLSRAARPFKRDIAYIQLCHLPATPLGISRPKDVASKSLHWQSLLHPIARSSFVVAPEVIQHLEIPAETPPVNIIESVTCHAILIGCIDGPSLKLPMRHGTTHLGLNRWLFLMTPEDILLKLQFGALLILVAMLQKDLSLSASSVLDMPHPHRQHP